MDDIKNLEGLEIFLGYKCNVKCNFCYKKDLRYKYNENISKNKVIELISDGYRNGKRFIIFSGGEPTLDENLEFYVNYSSKLGYKHIRVHSNGFKFKNYDYLDTLYKAGLSGVVISVHGYKGVHDKITKANGSFIMIQKALINFEKLKKIDTNFVFDTNTVVCKQNISTLIILFKFLLKFSISRRMIVYPYNIGLPRRDLIGILPFQDSYLHYIEDIAEFHYINNVKDFVIETIPYCLLNSKYWLYIEENYKTQKNTYFVDGEKEKNIQYSIGKIKFTECEQCIKNNVCYGFSVDYYNTYGKPIFTPLS